MDQLTGLNAPFDLLFSDAEETHPSLPRRLRRIYPGDWHPPTLKKRPYIYTNFATSRDGRISYNEPGNSGGGPISLNSVHDHWLMALLRMRAHAVLIGDVTLDLEPAHTWTAEFIYPPGAELFSQIRRAEGYAHKPLLVLLSYDGRLNFDANCFRDESLEIIIATTKRGVATIGERAFAARVHCYDLGADAVELHQLVQLLYEKYGVRYLLCEGGARVFANMLDAQLVDEEFVTLCPTMVGRSDNLFRPSYNEGVAWTPATAPYSKPLSLHRSGDLLFLRTRCIYSSRVE